MEKLATETERMIVFIVECKLLCQWLTWEAGELDALTKNDATFGLETEDVASLKESNSHIHDFV